MAVIPEMTDFVVKKTTKGAVCATVSEKNRRTIAQVIWDRGSIPKMTQLCLSK